MFGDNGWNFNGSARNEYLLKPLCQQVEKELQIADSELYRYFAVFDHGLKNEVGKYCRGVHVPAGGQPPFCILPIVQNEVDTSKALIYIEQNTCLDPTSCVITYAHELEHVVQYARYPEMLEDCRHLRMQLDPKRHTEFDIPTEKDANIVSKRIAERVCGMDHVRKFAEEQVRQIEADRATAQTELDALNAKAQQGRWEMFLTTPSSTVYDPVLATVELVPGGNLAKRIGSAKGN